MKTKLLASLAGFVLLAGTLPAQVPQLIHYQGRVAVGTDDLCGETTTDEGRWRSDHRSHDVPRVIGLEIPESPQGLAPLNDPPASA